MHMVVVHMDVHMVAVPVPHQKHYRHQPRPGLLSFLPQASLPPQPGSNTSQAAGISYASLPAQWLKTVQQPAQCIPQGIPTAK